MNAVKESGAVLVTRNLLRLGKKSQRESASDRAVKQDEDAEFIFPFDNRAGLGAMYILDDAVFQHKDGGMYSAAPSVVSAVSASSDRDRAFASAAASGTKESTGTTPIAAVKSPYGPGNTSAIDWATGIGGGCDSSAGDAGNALSTLVETVRSFGLREVGGNETECLGETAARKVSAHMHRIKVEKRRYSREEITLEELGHRNGSTVKSWLRCAPRRRMLSHVQLWKAAILAALMNSVTHAREMEAKPTSVPLSVEEMLGITEKTLGFLVSEWSASFPVED
eukprot:Plantae.Rhodophyta-Palmaria_palmata.ctg7846.p1 GENE.Plantae.Rhodophyta-Palmaria_palmata.ctg7846~~Plantae.Rhodophyta-Palmaria_palmata.ctg7846.p1  ORF type:complete len:308 (+),score=39.46 Plantae.Rhodophyta-Palmaria_palmata.ctg7846:82-924(+)